MARGAGGVKYQKEKPSGPTASFSHGHTVEIATSNRLWVCHPEVIQRISNATAVISDSVTLVGPQRIFGTTFNAILTGICTLETHSWGPSSVLGR